MRKQALLSLECLALFGGVPAALAMAQASAPVPFFPSLLGFLLITLFIGWKDPNIRFRFENRESTRSMLRSLFLRGLMAAVALAALTAALRPDLLFGFPRERPGIWAMVMLLYPLLSVAPQEFIFRTFFMQRYRPLFGNGPRMLLWNALAFGWAHVFFLNWIAPPLSVAAGFLLAHSWLRSRNFGIVCLEHAFYGWAVFTTGIGWYFYTGSIQAVETFTIP